MTDQDMQKIFYKAGLVAESLEAAASVLREMQESLPAPPLEELQDMAKGSRPLTSEAFFYAILHDTIPGIEEMAENLRRITPEILSKLQELGLDSAGINVIEQGIEELRSRL